MSVIAMRIDGIIRARLAPLLKEARFKKQARNFRRAHNDHTDVINVQAFRYNDAAHGRFTVNLGVYYPAIVYEYLSDILSLDVHDGKGAAVAVFLSAVLRVTGIHNQPVLLGQKKFIQALFSLQAKLPLCLAFGRSCFWCVYIGNANDLFVGSPYEHDEGVAVYDTKIVTPLSLYGAKKGKRDQGGD